MDRHQLKLANCLPADLRACDETWIAVALVSDDGFQFIQDHINPKAEQHWVVGVDLATSPTVLRKFMEADGTRIAGRYSYNQGRTFHPKVYVLRTGENYVAYVGSGNCTNGGFDRNVEVALRTEDPVTCASLLKAIVTWHKLGKAVDEDFLAAYEQLMDARKKRHREDLEDTGSLFPKEDGPVVDLSSIDFKDQFFKRKHFEAFTNPKPWRQTPEANAERYAVRDKLYELNERLKPLIRSKGWDLHEHYTDEHVVSHAVHGQYVSQRLDGIWLHYGRSRTVLKQYGEGSTPLDFMRMQVIVDEANVGLWVRISKDNGSPYDRQHIREKLTTDPQYAARLFKLISALPAHYYISLNDTHRSVTEFNTAVELRDHLLTADHKYYFIIGMEMRPDDPRLSDASIANTVMQEFEVMYPIYEMLLHRISN